MTTAWLDSESYITFLSFIMCLLRVDKSTYVIFKMGDVIACLKVGKPMSLVKNNLNNLDKYKEIQ